MKKLRQKKKCEKCEYYEKAPIIRCRLEVLLLNDYGKHRPLHPLACTVRRQQKLDDTNKNA